VIDCAAATLDAELESAPACPGVFAIWAREGKPYVSRTAILRRRLKRLLREPTGSRTLNLRSVCQRVEFWPVASQLEGTLVLYEVARRYLPDQYLDTLRLRMPPYVKLVTGIDYPRTQITSRIGTSGQYVGPFRSRAAAELFEHEFLDLFQIRRCQEDFVPAPDHPGCIYGEMNMCLRPCQQAVGPAEYASEVSRVAEFLRGGGKTLLQSAEAARDRLSAELDFEAAAREHKRVERIMRVVGLRDELAGDIDQLYGIAVVQSTEPGKVALGFVLQGAWQPLQTFSIALEGQATSMDRRMKEIAAALQPVRIGARERQEHLAILARWFYSSWRDGEWVRFEALDRLPYRKAVAAISRTADRAAQAN
jgi:excinuclease UvrABC nuclease subunit